MNNERKGLNRMTHHKAQVNCDGAPASLPGWYDFKRGTRAVCEAAAAVYRATGGTARTRVVPVATTNGDPESEARWLKSTWGEA